MTEKKSDKKAAPAKQKLRFDPFQENLDHIEDIGMGFINTFIQSIELPREKALAYRVCQVLETTALGEGNGAAFPILSTSFPKKRRIHKEQLAAYEKASTPLNKQIATLDGKLFSIRRATELRIADLRADEGKDGEEYRRIESEIAELRKQRGQLKNPGQYKARYPMEDEPEAIGRIDAEDWEQVKTYFADKVAKMPKRGPKKKFGINPTHANMLRMADYLGATSHETKVLEFALVTFSTFRMLNFFTTLCGEDGKKGRAPMRKCIARALDIKPSEFSKIMGPDSPLYKKGLLMENYDSSIEDTFGTPCLDEDIVTILQEPDISIDTMIGRILGDKKVARRKWADYAGMGDAGKQLRNFVAGRVREGKGASILLVSDFGIGKSTMIEALCTDLDVDLYVPGENSTDQTDHEGRPIPASRVRFSAWMHGQSLLTARHANGHSKVSALFMDEIGDLVSGKENGRQSDGAYADGAVSRLHAHNAVEFPGVITFFAGNNQTKWDPAFLSRMDLILPLRVPNMGYRKEIWQIQTLEQAMDQHLKPDDIRALAESFEIPSRLIEKAVGFARSTEGGKEQALFYLKSVCEVLYGGLENVEVGHRIVEPFYPDLLNPKNNTAGALLQYMAHAKTKPVTMHINGPDGTGKRLLAQQFANAAGRQLRDASLSDMLGQGIEDTRANIRGLFRAAAEDGMVLHLHGLDIGISDAAAAENPVFNALSRTLGEHVRHAKTPIILTTRHSSLVTIAPDVLTAFTSTAELEYLTPAQIEKAVTHFNEKPVEGVKPKEKEITPADVADAVRQMRMHDHDASGLALAIDRISKARRGQPTNKIGF